MTDTQDTTPKAKPRGVSLYPIHWEYLNQRAEELSKKLGKKVYASEYNQQLIEADMKKNKAPSINLVVKGE